jgi:hypothetical protein
LKFLAVFNHKHDETYSGVERGGGRGTASDAAALGDTVQSAAK